MKKIFLLLLLLFVLESNSIAEEKVNNKLEKQVITVDISVDKDQKTYIVSCLGKIKNNSDNIYRNINSKILLLNTNKEKIEEINLENIIRLNPREEKSIKIEKFLDASKSSPFEIRAVLEISSYESISYLDIANWFIDSQKQKLNEWNINYNESDFSSESSKRYAAINTLLLVSQDNDLYIKALNLIDKLRYEEALYNLKEGDYENSLINFLSVSNKTNYYDFAVKEINKIRSKIVLEKAKREIKNKNYFKALNLLRSISPNDSEYNKAIFEIEKLNFIIRTTLIELEKIDTKYKSKDELNVLLGMESNPEKILENIPEKNNYTWIFSDYSTFTFKEGNLINYRLYKLN
jgi:hypothetical protein